jgi:hypothetical protein
VDDDALSSTSVDYGGVEREPSGGEGASVHVLTERSEERGSQISEVVGTSRQRNGIGQEEVTATVDWSHATLGADQSQDQRVADIAPRGDSDIEARATEL